MIPHKITFVCSRKVQATWPLDITVCFFNAISITCNPFYQPTYFFGRTKIKEAKMYNVLVLLTAAEST